MFRSLFAGLILIWGTQGAAAPMTFEFTCFGNAVESCYIIAQGEINKGTPEAFQTYLEKGIREGEFEGDGRVLLHSAGGNLGAGLRLGRIIREQGLRTYIGETKPDPQMLMGRGFPQDGSCASACAYAYLGGVYRGYFPDSRLGFHRFYMGQKGSSSSAQQVAGQVVLYLVEMGIDPRIFSKASSQSADSMYWVTETEMRDFDLVTPNGYDPFFLEPYGNGVVAAARRQTETGAYDPIYQVTAYCHGGAAKLLLTGTFAPDYSETFTMDLDGRKRAIEPARVKTRSTEKAGFFEISLSPTDATALIAAQQVTTSFGYPRAAGGTMSTRLELGDMDRQMLAAAFRLCL